MNEPVLQIRLKKQLSGGRVPHLLQERVHRNKPQKYCESTHAHTATLYQSFPSHVVQYSMLLEIYFCSCNKQGGVGEELRFLTPHHQAFDFSPTAYSSLGMGNVRRQSTVAVCARVPAAYQAKAFSADCSHTHTFFSTLMKTENPVR